LILVGEHDHGTPPEMSFQMHKNIMGSELFIIPNAGHISNIEQEDIFNLQIGKFYQKTVSTLN
jgi:pimeloyl-ACP methyl ester carboxylesterase